MVTRFLVDQICTIDIAFIDPEPAFYLEYAQLAEIEAAVTSYLGL